LGALIKIVSFLTLMSQEKVQAKIMVDYGDHLSVRPSKKNDEIFGIVVVNKERTNHRAAPFTSQIAEECGIYPLLKQELCRISR
jgi:hypothetical protein